MQRSWQRRVNVRGGVVQRERNPDRSLCRFSGREPLCLRFRDRSPRSKITRGIPAVGFVSLSVHDRTSLLCRSDKAPVSPEAHRRDYGSGLFVCAAVSVISISSCPSVTKYQEIPNRS